MGFLALRKGKVSPFEEIVLMSIREVGYGATFIHIFDKSRQLGCGLGHVSFFRVELALRSLNMFGFIYSWQDRLVEGAIIVKIRGRSYRARKAKTAKSSSEDQSAS